VSYENRSPERWEHRKVSELDSQASAINALGAPRIVTYLVPANEFGGPDRRFTLIGDNANVVYAALYNAGHVRCIGFMHSYLGEQELSQLSDNVGSSPPGARRTIRGRIVTHLAFAYQVESALTVNAIVDHN